MCVGSSAYHAWTLLFSEYWFLPGEPMFCKICTFVTTDLIWCIINKKEVNRYLFLTLFSQDRPVAWSFALLLVLQVKPSYGSCPGLGYTGLIYLLMPRKITLLEDSSV